MRLLLLICACYLTDISLSARILVITPGPFYNHQIPYQKLWKALNARGHEIVLVTTNPMRDIDQPNFRQIDIGNAYEVVKDFNVVSREFSWLTRLETDMRDLWNLIVTIVFENPDVQRLCQDSGQRFDAVIVEVLYYPAIYAFAHKFNAPLIGVISLPPTILDEYLIGDVILPSYPATWESDSRTGLDLGFWGRVRNFVRLWYHVYVTTNNFIVQQQRIAEKYLGSDLPSLLDIYKNVSVIFTNEDPVITHVRPRLPKVVKFTSFHLLKKLPPLSKDIEEFIGNGTEGFVYFSLGTNAKSIHLSNKAQEILFDVFSELPCKVLWKYEAELPMKSKNIYTAKWFPQQTLLAHPKIRLFIYQGGLQSTQEAIRYTVPMIGIPMFVDQHGQVLKLATAGVAKYSDLYSMTRESLKNDIYDILYNHHSYKERMKELKSLLNDKPYDSLQHLIWWTEFVIRRKGASHLHFPFADQPWYRRYDMDVIGFLSIVIFIGSACALFLLCKILLILVRFYNAPTTNLKTKVT